LVRRYFEDLPAHPEACDEVFAPKVRFHTLQRAEVTLQDADTDPQSEKATYEKLRATWGDYSLSSDDIIAEADRVVVSWTFRGVHQGEFEGLTPTYRTVTYSGINIFRIADGRIAEVWDLWDRLWMWQQLGVLPGIKDAIERAAGGG